jgi:hypothetical protein
VSTAIPATVAPTRNSTLKYSCAQLGVCQGRNPPCIGCFDEDVTRPGELTQLPAFTPTRLERISDWGLQIVVAILTVVVIAGGTGYLITRAAGG